MSVWQVTPPAAPRRLFRWLLIAQGLYYLVTGVWPMFSRRSFEAVTGPKGDFWLVKTTGLLISVVGGALLMAGTRRRLNPETVLVGAGAAASLATIDVLYTARRRIPRIYLLDGLAQAVFLGGWVAGTLLLRQRSRSPWLK
ncbi:MAG: hypothetical protein ACKOC5_00580 [Chloroflexota bacterium]